MPISLSAKKSLRKSLKNRKENVAFKNKVKKIVKDFTAKPSAESLKLVYSIVDKAAKKNIFHHNKAARLKAKFSRQLEGKGEVKAAPKKTKTVKKTAKSKKTNKKM